MHNYSFHPMSQWVVNGFTKSCKGPPPPPHSEGCIQFFHHIKLTSESITEIGLALGSHIVCPYFGKFPRPWLYPTLEWFKYIIVCGIHIANQNETTISYS